MPIEEASDIWANMKALTGVSEIEKLMKVPADWLMQQPLVQGFLNHPDAKTIIGWLNSAENVKAFPLLIGQCGLAFLETSHGINRAYNSKVHNNLAAAGEAALSAVVSTSTEKGIYGNAINAFNHSLNLPELVKTGIRINQNVGEAWAKLEKKKQETLLELRTLRDKYFKQLEGKEISGAERNKLYVFIDYLDLFNQD